MMLLEYLHEAYKVKRSISPGAVYQYEVAVQSLDRWSGEPVRVDELCDALVNRWVRFLESQSIAPATLRNRRRHLLTLWISACRDELCPTRPHDVRCPPLPYKAPRAWPYEDVCKLLGAAMTLEGQYPSERWVTDVTWRLPRRVIWSLLIRIGWDTGIRLYDLWNLKRSQFAADGEFEIVQRKTGRWHLSKVHPSTMQAIDQSEADKRDFIVPWRASLKWFDLEFAKIVEAAEVLPGPFKRIRKSSATEVEKFHPGCGGTHLGHVSGMGIAEKHYLDPRLLVSRRPMPRELRPVCAAGALVVAGKVGAA